MVPPPPSSIEYEYEEQAEPEPPLFSFSSSWAETRTSIHNNHSSGDDHDDDGDDDSFVITDAEDKCSSSGIGPISPPSDRLSKSVSFHPDVVVSTIEVDHIRDFSDEDIQAIWYTPEDYKELKGEAKQSVKFIERYGIVDDDLEFSSRGLETKEDVAERRRDTNESVQAVMNEQTLQLMEDGGSLPELVAMLYSVYSYPCQRTAYMNAIKDAQDVGTTYVPPEELPEEDNLALTGESILARMVEEERISTDETFSSIEEWMVERFEKGQILANLNKLRRLNARAGVLHPDE
jgi:hypothetical protein